MSVFYVVCISRPDSCVKEVIYSMNTEYIIEYITSLVHINDIPVLFTLHSMLHVV